MWVCFLLLFSTSSNSRKTQWSLQWKIPLPKFLSHFSELYIFLILWRFTRLTYHKKALSPASLRCKFSFLPFFSNFKVIEKLALNIREWKKIDFFFSARLEALRRSNGKKHIYKSTLRANLFPRGTIVKKKKNNEKLDVEIVLKIHFLRPLK